MRNWQPIEFTVDHIELISRSGTDPFKVSHCVPLGTKLQLAKQTAPKPTEVKLSKPQRTLPGNERPPEAKSSSPQQTWSQEDEEEKRETFEEERRPRAPKPTELKAIVMKRLAQWVAHNLGQPKPSLPKTKQKLRSAIKPMCTGRATTSSSSSSTPFASMCIF